MNAQLVPPVRDLVLVGGGHANVQVLKRFGMNPEPGVRLTIVSEQFSSPYSGMLPGAIAGQYRADDIMINLSNLSRFASARLICATVTGVDLQTRKITLRDRPELSYDVLSINTGAVPISPFNDAVSVKPISQFLPKWQAARERLAVLDAPSVVIVGAGAGGSELALAVSAGLPNAKITLVGRSLLGGHNPRAQTLLSKTLAARGIEYVSDEVAKVDPQEVTLSNGDTRPADEVFWVTGVEAPKWLGGSGFVVDDRGFVKVNEYLQALEHPSVFVAGDAAHLAGQERAKSGVYAVRAGPILAHNVRAALLESQLKPFRAQKNHLALLGDGQGGAIASRGQWALQGQYWWRVKDWIDRRFMNKFNDLPEMIEKKPNVHAALAPALPDHDMRCGGCGAKIAAEPLRRVLDRLNLLQHEDVIVSIGDDAAQVVTRSGSQLMTIDGFRAMLDDPYLFGRVATHHSLNDIFAMGAKPKSVMTLVTVPLMADAMVEEELYQLMRGVVDVLNDHGAVLVGGHSAEGLELSLGLSVQAEAPAEVLGKAGSQVGDQLLLTKPLGTGTALAAAMQGACDVDTLRQVMSGMDRSNASAAEAFANVGAHALTDVTGFGLLGHLGEMMRGSDTGVTVNVDQVPHYGDAGRLIERYPSSLQESNELSFNDYELKGPLTFADPRVRLLADPQTSGGLLASVAPQHCEDALSALEKVGQEGFVIGTVTSSGYILQ